MSVDFVKDYADHCLVDNKSKYKELYKLRSCSAADVHRGDLVLLKTGCGCYRIYMATSDSDDDGTLHLTWYSEVDFIEMPEGTGTLVKDNFSDPCSC